MMGLVGAPGHRVWDRTTLGQPASPKSSGGVVLSGKRTNLASVCKAEDRPTLGMPGPSRPAWPIVAFSAFASRTAKIRQLQPPRAPKSANTRHGKARNDRALRTRHAPTRAIKPIAVMSHLDGSGT